MADEPTTWGEKHEFALNLGDYIYNEYLNAFLLPNLDQTKEKEEDDNLKIINARDDEEVNTKFQIKINTNDNEGENGSQKYQIEIERQRNLKWKRRHTHTFVKQLKHKWANLFKEMEKPQKNPSPEKPSPETKKNKKVIIHKLYFYFCLNGCCDGHHGP